MKLVISIIYIIFTSLGILFMKLGGDSLSLSLKGAFQLKIGFMTLLGLVFYLASFLLWQKIIGTSNISFIVPILTGIVQIIVLLIGAIIFKEPMNVYNIVGVILIVIGVVLIALKGKM